MPKSQPEKYDDRLNFRFGSADKKDLIEAAGRRNRHHNWLARHIIQKWLANERRRRQRRK